VTEFDKLQKNWQKLEPIFTQSADVKTNLRDTAVKFDEMNANFKVMVKDMYSYKTVKESSVVEGRVDTLLSLISVLNECERQLTQ